MDNETTEMLVRSFRYEIARTDKRRAYAEYNHAASALELATIRERAAECHSQSFNSLSFSKELGPITEREREVALAFVRYAVNGRI